MKLSHALLVALACIGGAACNGTARDAPGHAASDAPAVVSGTVIDAATGEPLGGVKIVGPHGTQCVSGGDGRFELDGLHAGDAGAISASGSDGRAATLELRPLRPGVLEVVLRLSPR